MSIPFPRWLTIAIQEIGIKEIKGPEHNPRVIEYHSTTTLNATTDEVPWCSSYVNWCIEQAGLVGTRLANARSWLNWGVPIERPRVGCVVVFKRGSSPTAGHVGFFVQSECVGADHIPYVQVIGGNQSDAVNMNRYREKDILGYRWPIDI